MHQSQFFGLCLFVLFFHAVYFTADAQMYRLFQFLTELKCICTCICCHILMQGINKVHLNISNLILQPGFHINLQTKMIQGQKYITLMMIIPFANKSTSAALMNFSNSAERFIHSIDHEEVAGCLHALCEHWKK